MKRLILVIALLFLCQNVNAANHYIRAGAAGDNSGDDWTNAMVAYPSETSWIRGDTYYFADGTIDSELTINEAVSGTDRIILKKPQ